MMMRRTWCSVSLLLEIWVLHSWLKEIALRGQFDSAEYCRNPVCLRLPLFPTIETVFV